MSMRLVILGLLMEGEKHPYEIQQLMKERSMDKYIKFQMIQNNVLHRSNLIPKKSIVNPR